jgi:transcriptional regulator with XRE-family HTH domain
MDEDELTFGPWLQRRRQALHLTQQELGRLATCSAP